MSRPTTTRLARGEAAALSPSETARFHRRARAAAGRFLHLNFGGPPLVARAVRPRRRIGRGFRCGFGARARCGRRVRAPFGRVGLASQGASCRWASGPLRALDLAAARQTASLRRARGS